MIKTVTQPSSQCSKELTATQKVKCNRAPREERDETQEALKGLSVASPPGQSQHLGMASLTVAGVGVVETFRVVKQRLEVFAPDL